LGLGSGSSAYRPIAFRNYHYWGAKQRSAGDLKKTYESKVNPSTAIKLEFAKLSAKVIVRGPNAETEVARVITQKLPDQPDQASATVKTI
jgi:hypothetical protein